SQPHQPQVRLLKHQAPISPTFSSHSPCDATASPNCFGSNGVPPSRAICRTRLCPHTRAPVYSCAVSPVLSQTCPQAIWSPNLGLTPTHDTAVAEIIGSRERRQEKKANSFKPRRSSRPASRACEPKDAQFVRWLR